MTRRYDLSIRQGEDWSVTVPVLAADDTPLALLGYTAAAQIRDPYAAAGADPLHEWTAPTDLDLSDGEITLEVSAAPSAAWEWTFGRWALELTTPAGTVVRLVEGAVLVDPETVFTDPV